MKWVWEALSQDEVQMRVLGKGFGQTHFSLLAASAKANNHSRILPSPPQTLHLLTSALSNILTLLRPHLLKQSLKAQKHPSPRAPSSGTRLQRPSLPPASL
jgi:hypothetical protein